MTDLLGPAYVSARWGYFLSVFLLIGASSFAPFFLRPASPFAREYPAAAGRLWRRAGLIGVFGAIGVLAFGALRLWLQSRTLLDPEEPLTGEFLKAVLATDWGTGWQRQMAAALAALPGFVLAARGGPLGWGIALAGSAGSIAAAGFTGHAATAESGPGGWLIDAIHVGAGGIWLGGLFVLLAAGLPSCSVIDQPARGRARFLLVRHFSRRALVAAPLTVLFGFWLGIRYLGWTWPISFYRSGYGWALAVKVILVVFVALLGAWNWRVIQPRLEKTGEESGLRRAGMAELLLGLLVLGATAVLVALPFE